MLESLKRKSLELKCQKDKELDLKKLKAKQEAIKD